MARYPLLTTPTLMLLSLASAALGGPIGTFTYVQTNAFVDQNTPVSNTTGATSQDSAAFSANTGFSGYTGTKLVSASANASSSLSTGELKVDSSLAYGAWSASGSRPPVSNSFGSATATATFGDSFRTYSGSTPFDWTGENATFNLDLSGTITRPAGVDEPVLDPYSSNDPFNTFSAVVKLRILNPGVLDSYYKLITFDFNTGVLADYYALDAVVTAGTQTTLAWSLGSKSWVDAATNTLITSFDGNPDIAATFQPGSDFDWVLSFTTDIWLDNSLQNVAASMDFSHTANVSYAGPAGATTYSASGLFPNTLDLNEVPAPSGVPEPGSFALMIAGGLAIAGRRFYSVRAKR